MGKKNRNKRFKNYGYNYRNQHLYQNSLKNTTGYIAKSDQINKIALEVFGSLHFQVTAED